MSHLIWRLALLNFLPAQQQAAQKQNIINHNEQGDIYSTYINNPPKGNRVSRAYWWCWGGGGGKQTQATVQARAAGRMRDWAGLSSWQMIS